MKKIFGLFVFILAALTSTLCATPQEKLAHLSKPVEPEDLYKTLEELIAE